MIGTHVERSRTCGACVTPAFQHRRANALNVEPIQPLARCLDKKPAHWPEGLSALRWIASGGEAFVFGICSARCPREESSAPEADARIKLFQDTVVRRLEGDTSVYLMNRQLRGWGERAVAHRSIEEIEALYAVTVGEWATDQHGDFAPVVVER